MPRRSKPYRIVFKIEDVGTFDIEFLLWKHLPQLFCEQADAVQDLGSPQALLQNVDVPQALAERYANIEKLARQLCVARWFLADAEMFSRLAGNTQVWQEREAWLGLQTAVQLALIDLRREIVTIEQEDFELRSRTYKPGPVE